MQLVERVFPESPGDAQRAAWLVRTMAGFGLLLMALTWRLWTPQAVFPQVPLVAFARGVPAVFDGLGAATMALGLGLALVAPLDGRLCRAALVTFAAATLAMVVLDQQRLQPWAYQFVILAVLLAAARPAAAIAWPRAFIVSFYIYSALTKLDYSFLHTLGQQFLGTLAELLHVSLDDWSERTRLYLAAVFPLGELIVALGLCFRRTRWLALAGAIVLHGLLLAILGPWGLDHKPGVLAWNAYFIVQNLVLFGPWPRTVVGEAVVSEVAAGNSNTANQRAAPRFVPLAMLAVMFLPLLEPTTWFDMWPSWGLYATSAERVLLLVHRRQRDALPESLAPFVEEPADADDAWLVVRLDRWALAALDAPIYPQSRTQLGVARAVIARYDLGSRARVARLGLADRFTGERETEIFTGWTQWEAAGDEYYLNTQPRLQTFQKKGV